MKASITASKLSDDGSHLIMCKASDPEASKFYIHGLPGIPHYFQPEFETKNQAADMLIRFNDVFEAGKKAFKTELKNFLR